MVEVVISRSAIINLPEGKVAVLVMEGSALKRSATLCQRATKVVVFAKVDRAPSQNAILTALVMKGAVNVLVEGVIKPSAIMVLTAWTAVVYAMEVFAYRLNAAWRAAGIAAVAHAVAAVVAKVFAIIKPEEIIMVAPVLEGTVTNRTVMFSLLAIMVDVPAVVVTAVRRRAARKPVVATARVPATEADAVSFKWSWQLVAKIHREHCKNCRSVEDSLMYWQHRVTVASQVLPVTAAGNVCRTKEVL